MTEIIKQKQYSFYIKLLVLMVYMQLAAVSHANLHQFSSSDQSCVAHINLTQFSDVVISEQASPLLQSGNFTHFDKISSAIYSQNPACYLSRAPPAINK